MNIKRVEKYVGMLKGIKFEEWLELQECINRMFKEKMRKFEAELNLKFDEEEVKGSVWHKDEEALGETIKIVKRDSREEA